MSGKLKKYKAWELLPEEKVYLKSEADKVIAEKDEELRHQKHKRCLDKAEMCENKLGTVVKPGWWDKWRRRWLELANKFKEVSK